MSSDLQAQINAKIEQLREDANRLLERWSKVDSPAALREMELEIEALSRQLAGGMTAAVLQHRLANPAFQAQCSAAARGAGRRRSGGRRECEIRLLSGNTTRVTVEYLKPDRRGRAGRRRGSGKRGKGGQGLYPALVALGITFGATPALASEVCFQVTHSESLRVGMTALKRRGIDLGLKPTRNLVNQVGGRANRQRHKWLAKARSSNIDILAGKRVVVATDGGRLRVRQTRRRGRRRKETGHRGFDAPWREPKMMVIYTVDEQGKVQNEFRPIYDGTLGDCDDLFDMLGAYLEALGAGAARELIVVGDGAEWIWNRIEPLRERLELQPEQVIQVIDWYHAVEVIHKIAKTPAKWSQKQRDKWVRKAKKLLFSGDIDGLVQFIDKLARGRRSKDVRKHIGYFRENRERMQYATFEEASVPLGSGCVESMIRRVVNLRLKGNAKFWLEENAEGMLLLRSYLKAGRFDDLLNWSLATTASWWPPALTTAPVGPVGT